MADAHEVVWAGRSGKRYSYWYHQIGTVTFKDEPGNYIYAKLTNQGWAPIYIGETQTLSDRIARHEKRERALRHGATHIHAHTTPGIRQARLDEETDLRGNYNPPCNDQ